MLSIIGASIIGSSFLLARPFPTMASSAQPSNDLPASGVIDLWDTSPETSRMMSLPGWAELQEVIKQEKLTLWRWLLSHHTSRCCQPRKQGGVVESLKEAGLDRVLGVCESVLDSKTVFQVRVQLDQLFEPDEGNLPVSGINPLVYCSTRESLPDLAKENACREIFTFLLAIAPQKVYVAPASMRDIERVRSAAEAFLDGRGVLASGTWAEHYLGNTRRNAKPEPKKLKVPKYAPTSDPKVQAERDETLINLVRAHWKKKHELLDPGKLPHQLFMAFAEYIPKGGLMFWLLRHPAILEVQGPAKPGAGPWTFSIKAEGGLLASGAANTVHQADPSLQQSLAQPSQPASSGAAASTPHTMLPVQVAQGSKLRHSRHSRQAQAQPPEPPHMMLLVQVAHGSKLRHSRSHHGRKTLGRKMLGGVVGGQAQSRAPHQTGQAQQAHRSRGLQVRSSRSRVGHDQDGRRHSGRTPRAGSELRGCSCATQSTVPSEQGMLVRHTKNKHKLVLLL